MLILEIQWTISTYEYSLPRRAKKHVRRSLRKMLLTFLHGSSKFANLFMNSISMRMKRLLFAHDSEKNP